MHGVKLHSVKLLGNSEKGVKFKDECNRETDYTGVR